MASYWESQPVTPVYPKPVPDYPPGTIRGPFRGSRGSPWPWQYAIRARGGWTYRHGRTLQDAKRQAEAASREIIEAAQD